MILVLSFLGCAGDEKAQEWAKEESKKIARKQRLSKLATVTVESKEDVKPKVESNSEGSSDTEEPNSSREDLTDDQLAEDYGNELTDDQKKEIRQSSHKNLWSKLQECREEISDRQKWGSYQDERQKEIWNEYVKTAQRNEQLERQVQDLMVKLNTQGSR